MRQQRQMHLSVNYYPILNIKRYKTLITVILKCSYNLCLKKKCQVCCIKQCKEDRQHWANVTTSHYIIYSILVLWAKNISSKKKKNLWDYWAWTSTYELMKYCKTNIYAVIQIHKYSTQMALSSHADSVLMQEHITYVYML